MQLQAKNLKCQRGSIDLFDAISFDLFDSESLLISGPNGIGKTTFLESFASLRKFSNGELSLDEKNTLNHREAWLENVFYLGHKAGHKKELTCLENLSFYMQIQEKRITSNQAEYALEKVGLSGYEYQMAGQLSAGQFKRLGLARLVLTEKKIWVLDEPFVNLDNKGSHWLLDQIKVHLNNKGILILSAHDHTEVMRLVTHEVLMVAS